MNTRSFTYGTSQIPRHGEPCARELPSLRKALPCGRIRKQNKFWAQNQTFRSCSFITWRRQTATIIYITIKNRMVQKTEVSKFLSAQGHTFMYKRSTYKILPKNVNIQRSLKGTQDFNLSNNTRKIILLMNVAIVPLKQLLKKWGALRCLDIIWRRNSFCSSSFVSVSVVLLDQTDSMFCYVIWEQLSWIITN